MPFSLAQSGKIGVVPTRADRPDVPTLCLVCGFDYDGFDDELPWGPDGDSPTYNFCPCCGVEFGYGDFAIESAKRWREKWLAGGGEWFKPNERPEGWDMSAQLARLPDRAK